MKKFLIIFFLCAEAAWSQGVSVQPPGAVLSGSGRPIANANVELCAPASTSAAQIISNTAVLTMSANPVTSGFVSATSIAVSGFTGGDTYFNGTYTILSVTSTTITYSLVHANASAGSNGTVLQTGNATTGCAGLLPIYSDSALTVPITQPIQTDGLGNYQFWASPIASAYVQTYGPSITTNISQTSIPCVPGSGCTGTFITGTIASTQIAFGSGANAISGSNNLEYVPSSGGVIVTSSNVGPTNVSGSGISMLNSGGGTTTYFVKESSGAFSIHNDSLLITTHGLFKWDGNGNMILEGGSSAPLLTFYTGASVSPYGDGSAVLNIQTTGSGSHVFAVSNSGTGSGAMSMDIYNGLFTMYGNTSGSASIEVAAAAGSPNPIQLPLTTGSANGLLQTDGGSPQQSSWTLSPSLTNLTLSGSLKTSNLLISHTAPAVSSGFGTSSSITVNNGTAAFLINVGTSNTGTGVLSLPVATTGWVCSATDTTTISANVFITRVVPTSVSSVTFQNYTDAAVTHAWTDSDILAVNCFAY